MVGMYEVSRLLVEATVWPLWQQEWGIAVLLQAVSAGFYLYSVHVYEQEEQ